MRREPTEQVIYGSLVKKNGPLKTKEPRLFFPGVCYGGGGTFDLDEKLLGRHVLLLGGSGCGKTNVFSFAMHQILHSMGKDEIAIVFDTKGEFYREFARPGDYVIGNSAAFLEKSFAWNIFDEILADYDETKSYKQNEYAISSNARELAAALFHGRGSSSQPFFCNAARDLFYAVLMHFIRQSTRDETWKGYLNNRHLKSAFAKFKEQDYRNIFNLYPDLRYMQTYIGDGTSNQALGVFGELNSMISEYFVGVMADDRPGRNISMRQAVRRHGGKIIFVEYDLAMGETLAPIYRLLVDQALKEALSRSVEGTHRCYLFVDEFKLLPKLQHIDDALNFGRGLGVRVMAGIQSINQLYDIYGREKGEVLAGGFGSMMGFYTNDHASRQYITDLMGTNLQAYQYDNVLSDKREGDCRQGNTVEIWEQMQLGVGQAVIKLGDHPPFLYQFEEYEQWKKTRR